MSAHKRHNPPIRVFRPPWSSAYWHRSEESGDGLSRAAYHTRQAAALAARQEANRSGFERRRELAQARQKAEEARKEARAAEEQGKRAPAVLGGLVGAGAHLWPRFGARGQGHGAIYGPIKQGTRQRTTGRKGRR